MDRKYFPFISASLPMFLITVLTMPGLAQKAPEIPSGTPIKVRMIDKLSSEESQIGDTFHGTLETPIEVNGEVFYPKGADVMGRVTDVHPSGRLSEPGELDLVLVTVSSGRIAMSLTAQPLVIKGESHTKSNVGKIGGGTALGAIIGGIAGGGKGAAIGAGVGAAAGTGAAAATGKRAALVESEAVLTFVTTSASSVTTAATIGAGETTATSSTSSSTASTASTPASENAAAAEDRTQLFTLRDRRIIRNCVSEHASAFPPGTTDRPELPAGSERQIRRGETLSSDVQRQVQSLPLACEEQLRTLPNDLERVVYSGRVLLIDSEDRILDMFYLDERQ